MPDFDLILRGGTVIDGTGAARVKADVAVRGDRIAAVGTLPGQAAQTIDAAGLVVAPGFIDVHNHSDGWLLKTPHFVSKTMQGFTTEVLASDGISYAPVTAELAPQWIYYLRSLNALSLADYSGWRSIGDYLAALDRRTAQNFIMQVPYANVRVLSLGWGRERPDDSQIRRMQYDVRRGMDDGATGISNGMDYVAQCFAGTDELARVIAAIAPRSGVFVTHVRYKRGVLAGVKEAVEIGRRAGVAVHISHLKGTTAREAEELLSYIDKTAVNEVDFTFDVYPYLPGSTMLNSLLPNEAWEDGPLAVLSKLADPTVRRRFATQLADYNLDLDHIRIAWVGSREREDLMGLSLAAYARQRGREPAEALADLLIEENLGVLCVFHVDDDRLVEPFLKHPKFMLGSDGIYFPEARIHPRQFGSAARMLGPLVRDRKLFTLEAAVRTMTSMPAARFGLTDRGVVRPGAYADLVVFDAERIADRATFDDPQQLAVGVEHVLVNGVGIVAGGAPIERFTEWPGRALRYRE
ncbi:MAG: D-aminoacylase [Planctomycetia bacterium]|nr:D-aminoacylase [Planctomycetia bacterium]